MILSTLLLASLPAITQDEKTPVDLGIETGVWHAELESPGGPLPFGLEIEDVKGQLQVTIRNGDERIAIPNVKVRKGALFLNMPHYQSRIRAIIAEDGKSITGTWSKTSASKRATALAFWAELGAAPRFELQPGQYLEKDPRIEGRWAVRFSSSERPAVGVFESHDDGRVTGTFLTSLGDYRYLEGDFVEDRLRLSCFDGAHAFLFQANLEPDGTLRGDFWSRDTWHETWIAELDPDAAIEDPLGLSKWKQGVDVNSLSFMDIEDGKQVSLGDESLQGKVRLIQAFGSWCPNCHDEGPFLASLWDQYHEQGLQIVGVAFEHSGNMKRDALQVQEFKKRHAIPFPLLLGGTSDKKEATKSFTVLDELLAYPTVLFVDSKNKIRYVHTGFSGPATGKAHEREKERFHDLVQELLAEADAAEDEGR